MQIEDKIAIVTGGSSGLGRSTVEALIAQQAKVAIFDVNKQAGEECADEFGRNSAMFQEVDVRSGESVEGAVSNVIRHWGAVHILVNCAGVAAAKRILDRDGEPAPLAGFASVIDINLMGTINVARVSASAMSRNEPMGEAGERGVIINTASIAAYEGQTGQTAYAASKGGIVALTLPMARDLAVLGIRVNAIAPGIMGTAMLLNMPREVQDSLISNIPFPKRLGNPEEFSALAIHIAENAYINGEVVRLDGALRMQPK